MATLKMTRAEYEKKYGVKAPAVSEQSTYGSRLKEEFKSGLSMAKEGYEESQALDTSATPEQSFLPDAVKKVESSAKSLVGLGRAAFSPITAGISPALEPVSDAVNYVGDKIGDSPTVQKFAMSKAGETTERVVRDISMVNELAGMVAGGRSVPKVKTAVTSTMRDLKPRISTPTLPVGGEAGAMAKGIAGEVIPTTERYVNSQISKALDLTPGDIKNIDLSTGNQVGQFVADNNLIGANKDITISNMKSFYKKSYDTVRSEIGKVNTQYNQYNVPRYVEALKQIKKSVDDVPGLQEASVEVENLLNKKKLTLNDVQRVKELMDEHFSLYKVTGDVKESIAKTGLSKIRSELKKFIEKEVKDNTGADIEKLNNDVSTTRSIMDAVEERSTRGLTRSHLQMGDMGTFGIGSTVSIPILGPMAFAGGAAAVIIKKIYESPTFKLKFAKWLDSKNDAARLQIKRDLEAGKIPEGIKINQSSTPKSLSQSESIKSNKSPSQMSGTTYNGTSGDFIEPKVPPKESLVKKAGDKYKSIPNKQGGFVKIMGKEFKQVSEATKKEMIEVLDYINVKDTKDFTINPALEKKVSDLAEKYNINQDWPTNKIAYAFEKLIERTKTGDSKVSSAQEAKKYKTAVEFVKEKMKPQEINIEDIRTLSGNKIDVSKSKLIKEPSLTPNKPIDITIDENGKITIHDGAHRVAEALRRGDTKIKAIDISKTKSQLIDIWNKINNN